MTPFDNTGLPRFWPAPAKLNLMLRVTARRADGYHLLQTVFQLLDIGDELIINPLSSGEIKRVNPIAGVDEQDDLTLRAAKQLKQATGSSMGVVLSVRKRLPMGAGLGGGSSNAATVLYALNNLWQTGLSVDELATIGLTLGADVPVFVKGASAWAEGVGEQLVPIALPDRWFLVLLPGVHVTTAEVFSDPTLTRNSAAITIRAFLDKQLDGVVQNDCQAVVVKRYPEIGKALNWLEANAVSRSIGMTGTGSSLFAVFIDECSARDVLEKIPTPWTGFVARGVNTSPLHTMFGVENS